MNRDLEQSTSRTEPVIAQPTPIETCHLDGKRKQPFDIKAGLIDPESHHPHPVRQYKNGQFSSIADPVAVETRIELDTGPDHPRIGMLCLPQQLDALAIGFLLGEGILRKKDLDTLEVSVNKKEIKVRGDFDEDALESIHERWTWGTGCGGGGTSRDLDEPAYAPLTNPVTINAQTLINLERAFHKGMSLWLKTGGVHACALADEKDGILILTEDIGRHNAFDKIMGIAALNNIDTEDKVVFTTGRLSAEIVSKAAACRIPILASRSAGTSLAIEVAKRFNMTLIGFVRGKRMNIYSGFERVICHTSSHS